MIPGARACAGGCPEVFEESLSLARRQARLRIPPEKKRRKARAGSDYDDRPPPSQAGAYRQRPTLAGEDAGFDWGDGWSTMHVNAAARPDCWSMRLDPLKTPTASRPALRRYRRRDQAARFDLGGESDRRLVPTRRRSGRNGRLSQMLSPNLPRPLPRGPVVAHALEPNKPLAYRSPAHADHTFLPGHRIMGTMSSPLFLPLRPQPQTFHPQLMFAKPEIFARLPSGYGPRRASERYRVCGDQSP